MSQPNMILIMTDQQKATSLQKYGNPVTRTPAIDRLADAGVLFSNAFTVYPVCVPSRCSVFTGRYPHVHGSVLNSQLLDSTETHFVQMLKSHGYRTALAGKNHCFQEADKNSYFDYCFEAGHIGPYGEHSDPEVLGARAFQSDPKLQFGAYASATNPFPPEKCGTALITDAAMEFVSGTEQDKPFFMWLSYPDPHSPYQAPEPYASMYDPSSVDLPPLLTDELEHKPIRQRFARDMFGMDKATEEGLRKVIAIYYGMISFIDDQIQRLIDLLDKLGLSENTIIVFVSDHGDYMGEHGLIRKSNALYDCLTHIPLIFKWKGRIVEGAVTEEMIENIDIMPTLLDLAHIPLPEGVQGKSYKDLLLGKPFSGRAEVYSEVGSQGEALTTIDHLEKPSGPEDGLAVPWGARPEAWTGKAKMVRNREWKLIHYTNGEGELYDLLNDPSELRNLYNNSKYDEVKQRFQYKLLNWCIESENPLPAVKHQQFQFKPH